MRGVWVFRGLGFQGEKGRIEAEEECEVRSVGGAREKVERGHWEGEKGRGRRRSLVVK